MTSLADVIGTFSVASPSERYQFLEALVRECHVRELSDLEAMIVPRLKVDFLQRLPWEVALHTLSFLDDCSSLVRASAVSRTWHRLATDEYIWGWMCVRYGYHTPQRLDWLIASLVPASASEVQWEEKGMVLDGMKARRRRSFFADVLDRLPPPEQSGTVAFRDYFRMAYLTARHWQKGGRILASYATEELADTDPDPNRRLALTCCAMDRDWIVVGLTNSIIYVFSTRTGNLVNVLQGHESGVWCLLLATGTQAGTPAVMHSARVGLQLVQSDDRPAAVLPLVEHGGLCVRDAAYAAQRCNPTDIACGRTRGWGRAETLIVSAGSDRSLRVWDAATGHCVQVLRGHTSTIRCAQGISGQPNVITGSRDGTVRVWDLEQGAVRHVLAGHQHSVRCLAVHGNLVASGSYDFTCRVWDWTQGQCLHVLKGHQLQVYAVALDGTHVITGSSDSTVRVWSAATGAMLAMFQGYTHVVAHLQLFGDMLATGSSDGRVLVYSLRTMECLYRICAHDSGVTTLQMNDRYMVTGGSDGLVKLWDVTTGRFLRCLCEPCETVWSVRFDEDTCVILAKRHGKCVVEVMSLRPM
ncbi:hypothetical protein MEQU1_000277 [Malassezia equina]|uniref:F-box domain-containing protein n=1 Tax=Malassezia equina TaxID=1381935 RepID=A0AAF0IY09_9BASI|nr:hypothetical protein MEQU1_000277 [Malassezia equina]